jgi:hypothetical protein
MRIPAWSRFYRPTILRGPKLFFLLPSRLVFHHLSELKRIRRLDFAAGLQGSVLNQSPRQSCPTLRADSRPRAGFWLLAAVLLCVVAGGCVQRRMTIRSNPPGALVYVDNYEIGTTPVSTDFVYYGKRKIRLVKDGYETLTVEQRFWPPWYQYFPLDFVAENIYPGEIRDEHVLDFPLVPQMVVPTNQLIQRAEDLRRDSHSQMVAPQPTLPRVVTPPVDTLPPGAAPPGIGPPGVVQPYVPQPGMIAQPGVSQPPWAGPAPMQPSMPYAPPTNPYLPGGVGPPLPPGAIPAVPGSPPPAMILPRGPGPRMPPPPPGVLPPPIQREVILSPPLSPPPGSYPAGPSF